MRFMKHFSILAGLAAALLIRATASATELYNLDFTPPDVGTYTVVWGNPTVQSSVGPMTDALIFHAVTNYDQIQLGIHDMSPGYYDLEFDVLLHNLRNSGYEFTIFLDAPDIRTVRIVGDASSNTIRTGTFSQPFFNDQVYHFGISVDFPGNSWSIAINGTPVSTQVLNATELDTIRFSMAPEIVGSAGLTGTYAALDNVVVTSTPAPEPGTGLFLCSGLALLFSRRFSSGTRSRR